MAAAGPMQHCSGLQGIEKIGHLGWQVPVSADSQLNIKTTKIFKFELTKDGTFGSILQNINSCLPTNSFLLQQKRMSFVIVNHILVFNEHSKVLSLQSLKFECLKNWPLKPICQEGERESNPGLPTTTRRARYP